MKLSENVDASLQAQSHRVDVIKESVQQVQTEIVASTDMLQTLLIGMENMSDSVR